jgi:hypothetical protein
LALAAIRAGEYDEADTRLSAVEQSIDAMPPAVTGLIHALRAYQLLKSGSAVKKANQITEALRLSKEAIHDMDVHRHPNGSLIGASLPRDEYGLIHNAIIAELIHLEAERLLIERESR